MEGVKLEILTIKYHNNEKEYARIMRKYYSKFLRTKFDTILALLLIILGTISGAYDGYSTSIITMISIGIFFIFLMYLANFVTPIVRFRQEKKFIDEYFLEFNEEGIDFKTKQLNSKVGWSYYNKVWESKEAFYLFYAKSMFTFIPKRTFENEEQIKKFRELLTQKISSKIVKF